MNTFDPIAELYKKINPFKLYNIMTNKPDSNSVKALRDGKKLTYPTLADHEFIYAKDNIVYDENDIKLGTIEQFKESEADFNWVEKK